jgi:hypothetical protein
MTEIDLSASWARWNSLLQKPLFSGPLYHDYTRHQLGLKIIFAILFPQGTRNTARTEIYPRVKMSSSVLYEWRTQWQRDHTWRPWAKEIHAKHHRVFTNEEETESAIEILTAIFCSEGSSLAPRSANWRLPRMRQLGAIQERLMLITFHR